MIGTNRGVRPTPLDFKSCRAMRSGRQISKVTIGLHPRDYFQDLKELISGHDQRPVCPHPVHTPVFVVNVSILEETNPVSDTQKDHIHGAGSNQVQLAPSLPTHLHGYSNTFLPRPRPPLPGPPPQGPPRLALQPPEPLLMLPLPCCASRQLSVGPPPEAHADKSRLVGMCMCRHYRGSMGAAWQRIPSPGSRP